MTGLSLTVDLPWRWRFDAGASVHGFDVGLRRRPPPRPPAPEVTAVADLPTAQPERPTLEASAIIDAERCDHATYGFTTPRWSALEGVPDP